MHSQIIKSCLVILITFSLNDLIEANQNLSCYQCTRTTHTECAPHELLPCGPQHDRCVTHIMKDADTGYKIKRECGLGPCSFNDMMMPKGLLHGMEECDTNSKQFFCIFCCRENGCNKDFASIVKPSILVSILSVIATILIN